MPENRNGKIIKYTVKVISVETGVESQLSTTETSLLVISLTPYKTYQFSVAASTAVGQGPYTSSISVTTPEDGNEEVFNSHVNCIFKHILFLP